MTNRAVVFVDLRARHICGFIGGDWDGLRHLFPHPRMQSHARQHFFKRHGAEEVATGALPEEKYI